MVPKKIVFLPHALERMKEREIPREFIKDAIEFPDKIERSSACSSRSLIKKLYFNERLRKEHLLLIILEVRPYLIEVITVIDTSKISKYF